jgi:phosphoglycerate dehydrogenase-like enzyme
MRILFCGDCFPAARSLLLERLPPDQRDEILVCDGPGLRDALGIADVVIPMMTILDAELLLAAQPRLIQQWGSGLEGVDLATARARGIWVASVPAAGCNADSVAEHMLLLMLALLRQLPSAQASLRLGILGAPLGRALAGRTVCLYGLGATALALARRLRPFAVRLIGITREPGAANVAEFQLDACYASADRHAALAQTDILAVCVRLAQQTRGLIDASVLAALPSGAYLVNAARGALIDYTALYNALASHRLAGAALDVYWIEPFPPSDPLLALPNVIATPHLAGVTDRSYAAIAAAVAANIDRLRRGEPPLNRAA